MTKLLRIMKVTKLVRLFTYFLRLTKKSKRFLNTNGFKYMLLITCLFVFLGGIAIHYAENMTFGDGIWWAFVTATTVGYGDISPSTAIGRGVATVLMLVGIGLIGSLTSTITSYFFNLQRKTVKDDVLELIKGKIDDIENLSDQDIDDITTILKALHNENTKNGCT